MGIGSLDQEGGIDIRKLWHGNGKGVRCSDHGSQSVQNRKLCMATLRWKLGYQKSRLKRVGDAWRLQVSDRVDIGWYGCCIGGANRE